VGANGSGKSNLLDVINLTKNVSKDIRSAMRPNIESWNYNRSVKKVMNIELYFDKDDMIGLYSVEFIAHDAVLKINQEVVLNFGEPQELYFRKSAKGFDDSVLNSLIDEHIASGVDNDSIRGFSGLKMDESLLRLGSKSENNLLFSLEEGYSRSRVFKDWAFGKKGMLRDPQSADSRNDILEEDFSNFLTYLAKFRTMPSVKKKIIKEMSQIYDGFTDFNVTPFGGSLLLTIEEGDYVIPSPRISDGTLRYLALVAILCDPDLPPLLCIEEPEVGLHPDMIHNVARLLEEASERSQIIVTTHSVQLIDSFSDRPEAVLVCDKIDGATQIKRLDAEEMKVWLKDYSLGQLWTSGQIGGVRS
jgi:predicted ATPase